MLMRNFPHEDDTMTEAEQENLIHQFRKLMERAVAKHRRENVNIPAPDEYMFCLAQAVVQVSPGIMDVRRPGRPRKGATPSVASTISVSVA